MCSHVKHVTRKAETKTGELERECRKFVKADQWLYCDRKSIMGTGFGQSEFYVWSEKEKG